MKSYESTGNSPIIDTAGAVDNLKSTVNEGNEDGVSGSSSYVMEGLPSFK